MSMKVTLDETVQDTFNSHGTAMKLHLHALVCHCECLSMNAANYMSACAGTVPVYDEGAYYSIMKKWGLIDGEGNPII